MKKSKRIRVFDEFGEEYDKWFDTRGRYIYETEKFLLLRVASGLPRPFIEIGSGSGRFAAPLRVDFAVEPSRTLRRISLKYGIIPIAADGEGLPFDESVFGTAFLIVVLCFADNPLNILRETYRILRPDGKLVIGLVLKESPWGRYYIQQKLAGHRFYKFADFYSFEEVKEMLKQAKFKIQEVYSTLFSSPPVVECVEKEFRKGYDKNAGFTVIIADPLKLENE